MHFNGQRSKNKRRDEEWCHHKHIIFDFGGHDAAKKLRHIGFLSRSTSLPIKIALLPFPQHPFFIRFVSLKVKENVHARGMLVR